MSQNNLHSNSDQIKLENVVMNENFSKLEAPIQNQILSNVSENDKYRNGIFSKIFGNDKSIISVYVNAIVIILLIIVGSISHFHFKDTTLWENVAPIITLSLGYMFGKNNAN